MKPEFDGKCAFSVSLGKKIVAGKENCYIIHEDMKYVFANFLAKFLFRTITGQKRKANLHWSRRK